MCVVIDVIQVWDTSGESNKQTDLLQWPVLFYSELFLFILFYHLKSLTVVHKLFTIYCCCY